MTHTITPDGQVITRGNGGTVIAVTTWPTTVAAEAYARILRGTVGGTITFEHAA